MSTFWDQHYTDFSEGSPSPFCLTVTSELLVQSDSVLELGCGNGRDGLTLIDSVDFYTGVDLSVKAIENTEVRFSKAGVSPERYSLITGDFSRVDFDKLSAERLVVYSRFSLHADSEVAEGKLLKHLAGYRGGPLLVCIEARTIFDELYGQGEQLERNAYMTDHYRRFIVPDEFREKVAKNFLVHSFEVDRGFAPYENEDPVVMRIIFSMGA